MKKPRKKYTRKGDSQAELRAAIKKAYKRIVGDEPSMGRLQFGKAKST